MENFLKFIKAHILIIATVIIMINVYIFYSLYDQHEFENRCTEKDGVIIKNELNEQFCFRPEGPGEKI